MMHKNMGGRGRWGNSQQHQQGAVMPHDGEHGWTRQVVVASQTSHISSILH